MNVSHPPLSVTLLEVSDGFLLIDLFSSYLPNFKNELIAHPLDNFDSIADCLWLQVARISYSSIFVLNLFYSFNGNFSISLSSRFNSLNFSFESDLYYNPVLESIGTVFKFSPLGSGT